MTGWMMAFRPSAAILSRAVPVPSGGVVPGETLISAAFSETGFQSAWMTTWVAPSAFAWRRAASNDGRS